jgi:hypothetical protein
MKVSSDTGSALELHKAGAIYTCKGLEGQTLAEACWMSLKDELIPKLKTMSLNFKFLMTD